MGKDDEEWIDITDVSIIMGKRYSKSRDLMLQGRFGEPKREGRTLLVRKSLVLEAKQKEGVK